MSKNNQNTASFMTNINKLVSILEQKDETISKWQAIKPGCDSPYNMKNHVEKLNRDLGKWQSLIPEAHTPKLAANKLAKKQAELEAWRNAIPHCETPEKLVKWHKKHQARPTDNHIDSDAAPNTKNH